MVKGTLEARFDWWNFRIQGMREAAAAAADEIDYETFVAQVIIFQIDVSVWRPAPPKNHEYDIGKCQLSLRILISFST